MLNCLQNEHVHGEPYTAIQHFGADGKPTCTARQTMMISSSCLMQPPSIQAWDTNVGSGLNQRSRVLVWSVGSGSVKFWAHNCFILVLSDTDIYQIISLQEDESMKSGVQGEGGEEEPAGGPGKSRGCPVPQPAAASSPLPTPPLEAQPSPLQGSRQGPAHGRRRRVSMLPHSQRSYRL